MIFMFAAFYTLFFNEQMRLRLIKFKDYKILLQIEAIKKRHI
jgi:hypothetical protein